MAAQSTPLQPPDGSIGMLSSAELEAILSGRGLLGGPLSSEQAAMTAAAKAGRSAVLDAPDSAVEGVYAMLQHAQQYSMPAPGSAAFQAMVRHPIAAPELFARRAVGETQQPQQQAMLQQHTQPQQPPLQQQQQQQEASSSGAVEPSSARTATGRAASRSRAAASRTARAESSGDSKEDTEERNGAPLDRRAVLKEKNRKAQKRFRERQRTKLSESEEKIRDLSAEVEALRSQCGRLENRNGILEKVLELKETKQADKRRGAGAQAGGSAGAAGSGSGRMETDPAMREALAKTFNLGNELRFTVREGHQMVMSPDAVRRLPWDEHVHMWREYVEALATCLVQAEGSTTCAAGQRLQQLVTEAVSLAACMAMTNPQGALTWHCLKMDSSQVTFGEEPPRNLWKDIMVELKLTPEQRGQLEAARREYLAQLGTNIRERQEALATLGACLPTGNGNKQTAARYLQSLDATDRLRENMREQHTYLIRFMARACSLIMVGFQGAVCIVKSHPWSPDVLSIVNAMAEADGEPDADDLLAIANPGMQPSAVQT